MPEIVKNEYNAAIDSKKRLTLRGAKYSFYAVKEYSTGKIVLNPRILVDPNEIPKSTLKVIENSIKNFNKGKVSKPLNLNNYE